MFFEKKGNLFIGRFRGMFGNEAVFHGFSTRKRGLSAFPYDSLNLGYETGDLLDRVQENRRLFFKAMAISGSMIASAQQVHGDKVVNVSSPGSYDQTDGLVTRIPGIALVVQTADCLPVYIYDPTHQAVGMIHAGWKGTVLKISSKAVREMERHFGTKPEDIKIFLGPSIGPCCYEVGRDVARRFSAKYISGGRLNLWKSNKDQLVEVGVRPERIMTSRLCTVCHAEWFFSHRASSGQTGRMMAILGLKMM